MQNDLGGSSRTDRLTGIPGVVASTLLPDGRHDPKSPCLRHRGPRPPSRSLGSLCSPLGARLTFPTMFAGLVLATFFVSLWGTGEGLARALRLRIDRRRRFDPERVVVAIALGVAAVSGLAIAAAAMDALTPPVIVTLLCPGLLVGWTTRRPAAPGTDSSEPVPAGPSLMASLLLLPTLALAAMPPAGRWEALHHRRLVEILVRGHGFESDPAVPFDAFPQGIHAFAALATSLGGIAVLRPLSLLLHAVALLSGACLARRLGGAWAMAIFLPLVLSSPTLVSVLPIFHADLVTALFLGASWLLLLSRSADDREPKAEFGLALALGLLGGAAAGVKYTAILWVAPLWIVVLSRPASLHRRLARLAGLGAPAVLFVLPFIFRSYRMHGLPFFPFFGIRAPPGLEEAFRYNFGERYGLGGGWAAPGDMVRAFLFAAEGSPGTYYGQLTAWPLLALPGVLWLARRPGPIRLVAGVGGVVLLLWALLLRRVPYLLPLWPTLAALSAAGLLAPLRVWRPGGPPRSSMSLLGLVIVVSAFPGALPNFRQGVAAWRTLVGTGAPWLEIDRHEAAALDWIRGTVRSGEAVALPWVDATHDLPCRILWPGAEEHTWTRLMIVQAGSVDGLAARMAAEGVRYVVTRRSPFRREDHPALDDPTWAAGFQVPDERLRALLDWAGVPRFRSGPFEVWEIHVPSMPPHSVVPGVPLGRTLSR